MSLRRVVSRGPLWLLVCAGSAVVLPPAFACACGAMEPSGQRSLGVDGETAAIVHDGTTQTVAMGMSLSTDAASVAFLLPVPRRAEVSVAGPELFDQLFDHTRPEVVTRYEFRPRFLRGDGAPGSAGGGAGVQVVGRQQVGDYDVAQLTGRSDAVATWLSDNGYRVRPAVVAGLDVYLREGWVVVAAKLVFDSERFAGAMRPLVLRFASEEIVYPMRLSALAEDRQQVRFYVFAEHRVDAMVGVRTLRPSFAGRVDAAGLTAGGAPAAAELIGDRPYFLTRFDDTLDPDAITTDLIIDRAADGDVEFRPTRTVTVDVSDQVLLGAGAALLIIAGVIVAVVLRTRRARPTPPVPPTNRPPR